ALLHRERPFRHAAGQRLDVAADREGRRSALTSCRCGLLCAALSAVACGEDTWHACLEGSIGQDKAIAVEVDHIFEHLRIWAEPYEHKDPRWMQLTPLTCLGVCQYNLLQRVALPFKLHRSNIWHYGDLRVLARLLAHYLASGEIWPTAGNCHVAG